MFRKIICTFGLMLSLAFFAMPTRASFQRGSVRILPEWGGGMMPGGAVTLYRVGEPVAGGYRMTDGLADWTVWEKDIFSSEVMAWLLAQPRSDGMIAEIAQRDGALFANLAGGLYLVMQEKPSPGFMPFSPVLVSVPQGENWNIDLFPHLIRDTEIPRTGDRPAPIIGAMGLGFSVAVLMVIVDGNKKR